MKKIIVASKNPVKINSALSGFKKMFPREEFEVEGVNVPSGVPDQPMGDDETYQGALNRAENAKRDFPNADYWVGMEGGLTDENNIMEAYAWMVVLSKNMMGKSKTATFELPDKVAQLVRQGMELAQADDQVFNRTNSKHKNGAVGILTDDVIGRTEYYEHAFILSLIPFKNSDLYHKYE
jgi:inosine/xanthosine triphosphatase